MAQQLPPINIGIEDFATLIREINYNNDLVSRSLFKDLTEPDQIEFIRTLEKYHKLYGDDSTPLSASRIAIGTPSGDAPVSNFSVSGLPTSDSGLSSGDVWRDGTTLKIVL